MTLITIRRRLLRAGLLALLPPVLARAQTAPAAGRNGDLAAFVDGVMRGLVTPHAAGFSHAAQRLVQACERWASAAGGNKPTRDAARKAWLGALLAWARLSALPVGALVARRSVRRIDFVPMRPPLVLRAIEAAPQDEADMEAVGSAAKGLGALEWLLWDAKAPDTPAARRYAVQMARDIAVEAAALDTEFARFITTPRNADEDQALLAEILNQWIGGLELLRMQGLVRPVQESRTRGRSVLPRALSGAAARERAARWQALRAMIVPPTGSAPPGAPALRTLEAYLRSQGEGTLADNLRQIGHGADLWLGAAAANQPAKMEAAARTLAVLKGVAEFDVAPALNVQVGFSDADGD